MKLIPRERRPHLLGNLLQAVLRVVFTLSELILRPFLWSAHEILGPFFQTTVEKAHPTRLWLTWLCWMPVYLSTFTGIGLPALIAFSLKIIVHRLRDPFTISFRPLKFDLSNHAGVKSSYSVVTANVCLCPGVIAKFNNLPNPKGRAKTIGERIFVDQMHYENMVRNQIKGQSFCQNRTNGNVRRTRATSKMVQSVNESSTSSDHVITHFPRADFLCLQETYDRDSAKLLVAELHKIYPWVVYDVGRWTPSINRMAFNSGLMFASRYEILNVDFKTFSWKAGVCQFMSTGLLMVKVLLEEGSVSLNKNRRVGYIFNTHLQPFQGKDPIVYWQMRDILNWVEQFHRETKAQHEDIMFDILCGDFNMDNMSPVDVYCFKHKLFELYTDVCREEPGKDLAWTVGTEMRVNKLMDAIVCTPEGLKTVLTNPRLRQQYILDADMDTVSIDSIYRAPVKTDAQGNLILSPVGGRRRVDVVLYKNDFPLTVESYNFVTRLASLTDHVPVAMTFSCK